jgi:hypothetical protein
MGRRDSASRIGCSRYRSTTKRIACSPCSSTLDDDVDRRPRLVAHHHGHCLNYLRQQALCHPLTLEPVGVGRLWCHHVRCPRVGELGAE